jgi:hypothetical protein
MRHFVAIVLLTACVSACARSTRSPNLDPASPAGVGPLMSRSRAVVEPVRPTASVITEPAASDLQVFGHGPEEKALIEHYPQANAAAFQFLFRRGPCLGDPGTCRGGGSDGASCSTDADCASAPSPSAAGRPGTSMPRQYAGAGLQARRVRRRQRHRPHRHLQRRNTIAPPFPRQGRRGCLRLHRGRRRNNRPSPDTCPITRATCFATSGVVAHNLVPPRRRCASASPVRHVVAATRDRAPGLGTACSRGPTSTPLGTRRAGGVIRIGVGHERPATIAGSTTSATPTARRARGEAAAAAWPHPARQRPWGRTGRPGLHRERRLRRQRQRYVTTQAILAGRRRRRRHP